MKNWTNAFLSNINVVYRLGGFYYAPENSDWSVCDDVFDQNIFYYIKEGGCSITIDGINYTGKAGDWFFIPAHTLYSYHNFPDKPFSKYWVHFNLTPTLQNCGFSFLKYHVKGDKCPEAEKLFEKFSLICNSKDCYDIIETKVIILKLLLCFLKNADIHSQKSLYEYENEMAKILSYINDNLKKPLKNDELAKHINMQTNYFIRYFKNFSGQTPQKYIMEKRIEMAKTFLEDTNMSMLQIAEQCGFCDVSHFSKKFKENFSLSPAHYKKYIKEKRK